MKKYGLLIIIHLFLGNISAQEKRVKIFPFKSAIIEYKYEAGLGGTHIKYIDDYGYKQKDVIRKEIKLGDNIEKQYETIILVGNRSYTINYQDTTVAVGRNSTYGYYIHNKNRKEIEVTNALIRVEGYEENGTKKYLGKECKVWKADKAKKFIWNGVELKSTINFFMMMVEKATSIEMDIEMPKNIFDIPQGLRYVSSDVYQGYSSLELEFDKSITSNKNENIKIEFSSSDLKSTENIPFYTQHGDELIQNGVNDYNKVDLRIIKSQVSQLDNKTIELQLSRTIIFTQEDGYGDGTMIYGKVQINKLDKEVFSYRYIIFDEEGLITGYSEDVNNALTKIFDITPNKRNSKLIFKPKNKAKLMVLGW